MIRLTAGLVFIRSMETLQVVREIAAPFAESFYYPTAGSQESAPADPWRPDLAKGKKDLYPQVMRILYFTSSTNRSGGGRQALYLARGMEGRGHSVSFFLPERSRLSHLDQDWAGWRRLGPPAAWRSALEDEIYCPGGPTVVHAFHNTAVKRLAWWGIFWKRRAACVAHRGVLFRPANPLPYWSPGIDCFAVNSAACGQVLRRVGLPARRIRLVPNAIPDERLSTSRPREQARAALGLAPEDLAFGSIANSSPIKGVNILLNAFARAFPSQESTGRSVRLLIKGLKQADAGEQHSSLAARTVFLPWGNDVADFLSALDIFVLPSLSESMPNTLLEAVRMGLPAIGSAVGAVPEILAACGRLVPPGNVEALALAMRNLAEDPALVARYGAAARLQGENYRQEKRLDRMDALYTELLRKKGLLA
ncbi:MAG: glycosyltransferase family 4 protein [Desulfovibrio sp.]|jgi:glycosyltransferase involved in cell wall biosynthesis|nr:glycosyltransferase family 4 protein [Desulfovibrio sp.]